MCIAGLVRYDARAFCFTPVMTRQFFMRFRALLACSLLAVSVSAHATTPTIEAALTNADRPETDQKRDADRKPADLIAFAGLKPGDTVADLVPGRGYFTRIFANVVGQGGTVYAVVPSEFDRFVPHAFDGMKTLAAAPAFANVQPVKASIASFTVAKPLDIAWTSQNYHDIYGMGTDTVLAFDRQVFAALKPGGIFMVIDHVAAPGTDATAPTTLHRIDPDTIRTEVTSVGFQFVGQSPLLRNPQDDHTRPVFDPAIRGKTDQVVLKFRKPA